MRTTPFTGQPAGAYIPPALGDDIVLPHELGIEIFALDHDGADGLEIEDQLPFAEAA